MGPETQPKLYGEDVRPCLLRGERRAKLIVLGSREARGGSMAVFFPSLGFFQGLQQRTKEASDRFEKLGYCDTTFGVRVDEQLFRVTFEVYECTAVGEGNGGETLDFVLAGSVATWTEMLRSICEHGGADAAHTLNTLTHIGDVIQVEYDDAEGYDKFFRYMASLQEFFDQAHQLDLELG